MLGAGLAEQGVGPGGWPAEEGVPVSLAASLLTLLKLLILNMIKNIYYSCKEENGIFWILVHVIPDGSAILHSASVFRSYCQGSDVGVYCKQNA